MIFANNIMPSLPELPKAILGQSISVFLDHPRICYSNSGDDVCCVSEGI